MTEPSPPAGLLLHLMCGMPLACNTFESNRNGYDEDSPMCIGYHALPVILFPHVLLYPRQTQEPEYQINMPYESEP